MSTNKQLKPLPKFNNEEEEQEFWDSHSSMDYINWDDAELVTYTNLKPSTETISLRLPKGMLARIKVAAHKLGVPYQSFLKIKMNEMLHKL